MKKNNAILAGVAAVALAAAMVPAAFAVTGTTDQTTASADVKYTVTQGYEWTIHSEINFGQDKGVGEDGIVAKESNAVTVLKNIIPSGKNLVITVVGSGKDGAFTITNATDGGSATTVLPYSVAKKGTDASTDIQPKGTVLTVAAGKNTDSADLTFTLAARLGTAEVAGSYKGTVTYTASIQ